MNAEIWRGRRVLVTGHTGFKGSWLVLMLRALGAEVIGYALAPPTDPSLFLQARIGELVTHIQGDVRDAEGLERAIVDAAPEVVFHLAAQSLVRYSYGEPVETYATNVMGTVHLLEACRHAPSVTSVICVTSDKCYENRESVWPYRETDAMGGHDPYSSSKGAAELVVSAYRRSYSGNGTRMASVRAGNVIGGGDWALDRLVPDVVRALEAGRSPAIRFPQSIRPWQHVLDALGGYILVAERLLEGDDSAATGWNFGPGEDDTRSVAWIVDHMMAEWGVPADWTGPEGPEPHEAALLKLDCSKARSELGWRPAMVLGDALRKVVDWHRAVARGADAREISVEQVKEFLARVGARSASRAQW